MHTDVMHKATFSGFEMLEHRDVQVHIVAGLQARVYIYLSVVVLLAFPGLLHSLIRIYGELLWQVRSLRPVSVVITCTTKSTLCMWVFMCVCIQVFRCLRVCFFC